MHRTQCATWRMVWKFFIFTWFLLQTSLFQVNIWIPPKFSSKEPKSLHKSSQKIYCKWNGYHQCKQISIRSSIRRSRQAGIKNQWRHAWAIENKQIQRLFDRHAGTSLRSSFDAILRKRSQNLFILSSDPLIMGEWFYSMRNINW